MKIKLEDVRLSFPRLFVAKEFKPGDGKPRFDATFLIEPGSENDKLVRAAIEAEAAAKFGAKASKQVAAWENNNQRMCYTDGDLSDLDGYEGMMVLATHNKVRPGVFDCYADPQTGKVRRITSEAEGKPYAGCYVNAFVEIYAQNGENPGIRGKVTGVQFLRDGDAFAGGRPATEDDFDALDVGADAEAMC